MASASPLPAPAPAPAEARPARRTYAERYRLVRSLWNDQWWTITFGGPVGNLLNAAIADIPWITPNGLTWLGFLCNLVGGVLLLADTWSADLVAVVLFQLHVILDCMDGNLARYRKASSSVGAFLDKATDMIGLFTVTSALGWRIYTDTGDAPAMLISVLIAAAFLLRNYVFWVVAVLERDRRVPKPTTVDNRRNFSTMTFRERALLYARSMGRIVEFSELDLYFWFGLGIVLGRMREVVYLVALASSIGLIVVLVIRFRAVMQLDRLRRVEPGA
jgi:phosphatidylglycerophosphate synthase